MIPTVTVLPVGIVNQLISCGKSTGNVPIAGIESTIKVFVKHSLYGGYGGLGVFAATQIKKGSAITTMTGIYRESCNNPEMVNQEWYEVRKPTKKQQGLYLCLAKAAYPHLGNLINTRTGTFKYVYQVLLRCHFYTYIYIIRRQTKYKV